MCTTLINENNVKPIAIYVHGLGSGATSTTVRMVCKIFSEYEWIAIEVNENPFESVEKINATVSKFNPSLLMGTSLGGYYVFYADAPCATKVICNPGCSMRDKGDLQPGNEYSEAYTLQDRIRDIFLFCRKAGRQY